MTTMMVGAGPLVRLSAPLPQPRRFTLLDAATLVTPVNDRWLTGATIEDYPTGEVGTHDACSTGTDRVKDEGHPFAQPTVRAFTAYLAAECTSPSIGADPGWFTDRLKLAFQAVEAAAAERVLATGDGHGSAFGAFLADANMEALNSGAVTNPVEAMGMLEEAIAPLGDGIIHAAPVTATHWSSRGLISEVRNQLVTKLGTPVAVGAGYMGVDPDGQSASSATQEWAFASGPVEITRAQNVLLMPADYAQALDRTVNTVVYLAERDYLLNWVGRVDPTDPDHVQAGVLVDRTSTVG